MTVESGFDSLMDRICIGLGCRRLLLLVTALTLLGAACGRAAPSVQEMSRIWRATAPKDDSYGTRCNDERRRLGESLGQALVGLSRGQVIALLGEPDQAPHPEATEFGPDNLNYSLGWCDSSYPAFVVSFRAGRVREARQVPSG